MAGQQNERLLSCPMLAGKVVAEKRRFPLLCRFPLHAAGLTRSVEVFGAKMWQVGLEEEAEQAGTLQCRDRLRDRSKWLLSARNRLTDRPQRWWKKEIRMLEFCCSPEATKYYWLGKQNWKEGHAFPSWAGCRLVFKLLWFEFYTLKSWS